MSAWTPIPKPNESSTLGFSGGEPIGMLLALTKSVIVSSVITGWTDISKPSPASWISVAKPITQTWTSVTPPTT